MFTDTPAAHGFAVPDLAAARTFYADTLGLRVSEERGLLMLELTGHDERTILYPKPDHVPATFTVLNFRVPDIDAAVGELEARGVRMERYPDLDQDEHGVLRSGDPLVAWFTDPAGNILSVLQTR